MNMNTNMKNYIRDTLSRVGGTSRTAWACLGEALTLNWLMPALIAVLSLLPAGRATAQTFTTLHSFTATSTNSSGAYTNSEGAGPAAASIGNSSGDILYGTAEGGGGSGDGTVFAVHTDGSAFTALHNFAWSDGANPQAELLVSGHTLYGTASGGGDGGGGTVFAVNTDGTGFTTLHSFRSYDGADPVAGLILSGDTLYGTTAGGGSSGNGTVFAVKTDGTGFSILHSFTQEIIPCLNGSCPSGYHCVSGICVPIPVYGCPGGCGPCGYCVCVGDRDGNNIFCYCAGSGGPGCGPYRARLIPAGGVMAQTFISINLDGANPMGGLVLSNNILYGTAAAGGSWGAGTVFAVNTDGTGFSVLHSFIGGSDGNRPDGELILSGNTLYGTGYSGASSGLGTVFAVNTDGTGFTNLYDFTGGSDGANPVGGLIFSSNTLHGTARYGGSSGNGTVFSISLPPLPPVARCKNVTVSADVSCTADASIDDGSFSPNAGGTISLVKSPSGPYPLGDTSVTLTVTDNHGLSNNCVATVTVVDTTPCLIALVQSLGLPSGTANSLIVKLQAAAGALDRGNIQAACGSLGAFLNEVNAQTGKHLTTAQADLLSVEATRIRAVLGCN